MIIKIYHYFVFIIILIFFFIVLQGQYYAKIESNRENKIRKISEQVCFLNDCDNTYVFQKSPDQVNMIQKIENTSNITSN